MIMLMPRLMLMTRLMLMLMERVDRDRMTESRDELARMLGEDELRDAVLLVIQKTLITEDWTLDSPRRTSQL